MSPPEESQTPHHLQKLRAYEITGCTKPAVQEAGDIMLHCWAPTTELLMRVRASNKSSITAEFGFDNRYTPIILQMFSSTFKVTGENPKPTHPLLYLINGRSPFNTMCSPSKPSSLVLCNTSNFFMSLSCASISNGKIPPLDPR